MRFWKEILVRLPAITVSVLALLTVCAYLYVPSVILIDICQTLGGGWRDAQPALLILLWMGLLELGWGRAFRARNKSVRKNLSHGPQTKGHVA